MEKTLLVVSDFGPYKKGDLIENKMTIASIMNSGQAKFVIVVSMPKIAAARVVEQKSE
ncbi:hypothetical protein [Acetobacter fallax]|uniref:Uncharacterized protein n=1 Tax=Acetobacter fallax TaxID=1737473 RepID=A0ABX0KGZ2_9PROT|nr:hypothetical protein [Acetobacter fallax]NHO34258.1 hypothetical protein [Acetobacter fallax]NHO37807.1 hypothetical protein [Acetobacter fallax]